MITAFISAGFPPRKRTSNTRKLLDNLTKDHQLNTVLLTLPESENPTILGIRWYPKEDALFFTAPKIERKSAYTVVEFFDPAGWLAPIIRSTKIVIQQICQDNTAWDECLNPLTLIKWHKFFQFYDNGNIRVRRWIHFYLQH